MSAAAAEGGAGRRRPRNRASVAGSAIEPEAAGGVAGAGGPWGRTARREGARGEATGRGGGGAVPRAVSRGERLHASTPATTAAAQGPRPEELSPFLPPRVTTLEGGFQPEQQSAAVEDPKARGGKGPPAGGGPMSVWGALTPVALRASSVSAPPNRNFLLCLDSPHRPVAA